jgi:hypothetical protein
MVVVSVTHADAHAGPIAGASAEPAQKFIEVAYHRAPGAAPSAAMPARERSRSSETSVGTSHKPTLMSGACTLGGRGRCCARYRLTVKMGHINYVIGGYS